MSTWMIIALIVCGILFGITVGWRLGEKSGGERS